MAATPGAARRFGPFCAEHGADLFLVQSQVSSARHLATDYDPLSLEDFTRYMPIPVAVGNTTNAEAAFALMEQGAAAVFVGVGPGAACTTREVLGIGVPQVTAISDVAAARDAYFAETGRYVPVVADGGMRRGGELAKAIAAGADALMIGSPLAKAEEAPGRGTNWGMAAPSPTLPRGTRIKVGTTGTLERILMGPAHVTDGSENLVGSVAPVDGRPRGARRSATCSESRWSTHRPPRPKASPGSGVADPRRPGRRYGELRPRTRDRLDSLTATATRPGSAGMRFRITRVRRRALWALLAVAGLIGAGLPATVLPEPVRIVTPAGVTIDGSAGEWSRPQDFLAYMYEAGKPDKRVPVHAVCALRLRDRDDVRIRGNGAQLDHPAVGFRQLREDRQQRQARRWCRTGPTAPA